MKAAILTSREHLFGSVDSALSPDFQVCAHFPDAVQLIRAIKREVFSVIVVDANHSDALEPTFWATLRGYNSDTALMSAIHRTQLHHTALTRAAGADDVLLVPADANEIRLRVQFLLKRLSAHCCQMPDTLECGEYSLDRHSGLAWVGGTAVPLTTREFALAWMLFLHKNRSISRCEIATHIWGNYQDIASRSLEQHIYKLRRKLKLESPASLRLDVVHGHGYRLSEAELTPAQHRYNGATRSVVVL